MKDYTVQRMYSYYDDVNGGQPCAASSERPLPNLRAPYQQFILRTWTPLDAADAADFDFVVGDYNGDGNPDLFCLRKTNTGTGSLEVHVLSHASNYQQLILRTGTPLDAADAADFDFVVGDYNGDGNPDLFCLRKTNTRTGSLEVHVLSHASNYQQFIRLTGTPLDAADAADFDFVVGDYNGDGNPDLFCLRKTNTRTGSLEVHVLSHASNYQQFIRLTGTPLDAADAADFDFVVGDYNGDGNPDLFCLRKTNTRTGSLEVHVLSHASNYQQFARPAGTLLDAAGAADFDFVVGDYHGDGNPDLFCLRKTNTRTGSLEVHVLGRSPYFP